MNDYIYVLIFSFLGGIISLAGGLLLISSRGKASAFSTYATPFAAGALLAAAFLDLLPEAGHQGSHDSALLAALVGILLFFLLEKFLRWFHHHHDDEAVHGRETNAALIIVGDTVHNFIDGIAIAAGFMVSIPTGIVVSLAVAAHEIPQEIGDFGLLLKKGLSVRKVIFFNILSAFATVIAATIFYFIGETAVGQLDIVLGLTAGFFIYIAASDIIPSIHESEGKDIAGPQTALLIAGVLIVGLVTATLHDVIEADIEHDVEVHSTVITT